MWPDLRYSPILLFPLNFFPMLWLRTCMLAAFKGLPKKLMTCKDVVYPDFIHRYDLGYVKLGTDKCMMLILAGCQGKTRLGKSSGRRHRLCPSRWIRMRRRNLLRCFGMCLDLFHSRANSNRKFTKVQKPSAGMFFKTKFSRFFKCFHLDWLEMMGGFMRVPSCSSEGEGFWEASRESFCEGTLEGSL